LLLLFNSSSNASSSAADSIRSILQTGASDSNRVLTLRAMASTVFAESHDSAIYYSKKALELARQLQWLRGSRRVHEEMGRLWRESGDYIRSLEAHQQALSFAEKEKNKRAQATNLCFIGLVHFEMEDYEKSLYYYNTSRLICKAKGYKGNHMRQTNNLGTVYLRKGLLDSAIFYFEQSYSLADKLNQHYAMSLIGVNLANCYSHLGKFENGRAALDRSVEVLKSSGELNLLGQAFGNIGIWYLQQVKSKRKDAKESPIRFEMQMAIEHFHKAIRIHDSTKQYYMLKQWYYNLRDAYHILQNTDSAIYYYRELEAIRDTLFSIESKKQIAQLEAVREVAQQEAEIASLHQEKAYQNLLNKSLLTGMVLLLIVAVLLVLWLRAQKKRSILAKESALLREQQLRENLDLRNRQLTSHALQILQKNNVMEELKADIKQLRRQAEPEQGKDLGQLVNRLTQGLQLDQDWDKFKIYFEEVHPQFFKTLNSGSKELTNNELRHAAMVKLGMSLKESASILSIEPGSVKIARNRLKKKLGLKAEDDLNSFLRAIK